jgi:diguanylate cyclase (GGDEF)-like protein
MESAGPDRQPFGASPVNTSSKKLIALIRSAYWFALMIIAAIATASFILLQQMMAEQQRDAEMLSLVSTQKALSQRIVFLAGALDKAEDPRPLLAPFRRAVTEFETNQDVLLASFPAELLSLNPAEAGSIEAILFSRPYHLSEFATGLANNGWRLLSATETELGVGGADYRAGLEKALLDETVANASLEGFTALGDRISAAADERLERTLLLHKVLFVSMLGVIFMVALFIFRPMAEVIRRKTDELMEARNSMAFLAVHDRLTGLHNRAFLTDHFDMLIKGAARRDERLAVMQLDLDRFKQINDTLGHAAGDYVLIATAQRMRETCRASDICVRLGGDEFVLILQAAGTLQDVEAVATRIMQRINNPIGYHGATIQPGASAGIAIYPDDADNGKDLLVHADLALYAAKKIDGSGFSFFSDELRQDLERRRYLERALRTAIVQKSFEIHFQPQVSLSTGKVIGIEALVRWDHKLKGAVAPSEFIPIAEKAGMMCEIGRIVVGTAIKAAAGWHRSGLQFGRLAVNVSGSELRDANFDKFLFDTLYSEGLPARKLALEIVESVILDDEKTGIAAKLRRIRSAGVHLELDDFGTGYASLSHVNPNEIDRLKIDRRFVQNIDTNVGNAKIVRAITELARSLGISIIAEGAETEAELNALKALGCDLVQGYSVAVPMSAQHMREWLQIRSPGKPRLTLVQTHSA